MKTIGDFYKKNNIDCLCLKNQIVNLGGNNIYGDLEVELETIIQNPKMVLVVIEHMCLGILLSHYHACQLPYLETHLNLNTDLQTSLEVYSVLTRKFIPNKDINDFNRILVKDENRGCQKIIINSNWDTNSWEYTKLCKLPNWIDHISCQKLAIDNEYNSYSSDHIENKIDKNFLEAMGVEITQSNETSENTDNTDN